MTLISQVSLGCLCLLVSWVQSAAVYNHEHIVVIRSANEPTTKAEETKVTSKGPDPPIKLTEMDVTSKISMRYANTEVLTYVRNPGRRAQEATFRLVLPETAFISSFTMTINGKDYKAYVKEKEEAKQIYTEAVSQGFGAAHVAAKARDSNHFTVSVNVEPESKAIFNLTYEEMLVRRNGVYNQAINLHPGSLVPQLTVTVHIKESQKLNVLRVPEIRTGNEIDATETDAQNSKAIIIKHHDDHEATIIFTPDLEEQKRLLEIYAQKSKASLSQSNNWSHNIDDDSPPEGVLGQFVVQYDVDRPKEGEILVNNGYFVHYLAPSTLPPLSKYVIFVLDTSGSMYGRKMEQLRAAMQSILPELKKGDYFNIVEFASSVTVHDLSETGNEKHSKSIDSWYNSPSEVTLVPPSQATSDNIAKAKTIVERLDASGGTNIDSALDTAVGLANKGFDSIDKNKFNNLERIIIFLTDGEATVGEIDTRRLNNRFIEKNSGEHKAALFTLAFGEDADRAFLRKLSLSNNGFSRHIYEDSDASLQLRDFYRQVSSPLLSNVTFTYPPDQVKDDTVTRHRFPIFYDGGEIVVAGKIFDLTVELTPTVSAYCAVDEGFARKPYELFPKIRITQTEHEYLPLERLWAYLTIKQLLDQKDVDEITGVTEDKENNSEKKALQLALKYEFVTPLTSLVVVRPNDTKAVDAESVDKAGSSSYGAVGLSAPQSQPFVPASGVVGWGASFNNIPVQQSAFSYGAVGAPAAPAFSSSLFSANTAPATRPHFHSHHTVQTRRPVYKIGTATFATHLTTNVPTTLPPVALVHSGTLVSDNGRLQDASYDAVFGGGEFDPSQSTTTAITAPAATESSLAEYHLQNIPWVLPLLNRLTDEILIQVNGTIIRLKLTKELLVPTVLTGDTVCPHATDGATGSCVYLTRCDAAQNITQDIYASSYCFINDEFAGVCCPREHVIDTTTGS